MKYLKRVILIVIELNFKSMYWKLDEKKRYVAKTLLYESLMLYI